MGCTYYQLHPLRKMLDLTTDFFYCLTIVDAKMDITPSAVR
jgi:hypothetical protein